MNLDKPELDASARILAQGVFRLARRLRIEHGDAGGLSSLSLLAAIHRGGPATASHLATEEGLQPQSLTRLIAGLETRGLVARRRDEADGRRVLIKITSDGRRTLAADMGRLWDWLAEAMSEDLDPNERQVLIQAGELMARLAMR